MTQIEQMVEQHIREHESRLGHLDELLQRARRAAERTPEGGETSARLAELERERDRLAVRVDELKLKSLDDWQEEEIERSGPMGIWDSIAQQLEKLVEHLER
jgi:hypothetical protein